MPKKLPPKKIPHVDAERIHGPGGRTYRIDGVGDMPSVTTVLGILDKPALIGWAKKVSLEKVREELADHIIDPEALEAFDEEQRLTAQFVDEILTAAGKRPDQIKDAAADLGTRAHEAIQDILDGKDRSEDPEIGVILDGFDAWRDRAGIVVDVSEQTVFSREHWYAGTLDAVGWLKVGSRWRAIVIDWKTSLGIYPESACQVVAYGRALEEMVNVKVHEHWVVRFGKATDTFGRPTGEPPRFEARKIHDTTAPYEVFLAARRLWQYYRDSWRWWGSSLTWTAPEEEPEGEDAL
jgi:hypothetical protein